MCSSAEAPGGSDRPGDGSVDELRGAAEAMRRLVPEFRGGPVSEFVPLAVAKLLDAVADSLDRGDEVRDPISSTALEIARHVTRYHSGGPGR